jgi:hypothetical protein
MDRGTDTGRRYCWSLVVKTSPGAILYVINLYYMYVVRATQAIVVEK